jgi:hypothetical protein
MKPALPVTRIRIVRHYPFAIGPSPAPPPAGGAATKRHTSLSSSAMTIREPSDRPPRKPSETDTGNSGRKVDETRGAFLLVELCQFDEGRDKPQQDQNRHPQPARVGRQESAGAEGCKVQHEVRALDPPPCMGHVELGDDPVIERCQQRRDEQNGTKGSDRPER